MINAADYDNLLLNGWDIHQWAVAIDRLGLGGTQMKYADKLQRDYLNKFGQNPLEFQLIGITPGTNYDLAAALFEQTQHRLESVGIEEIKDSSYSDQEKDDREYDDAWKIRVGDRWNS